MMSFLFYMMSDMLCLEINWGVDFSSSRVFFVEELGQSRLIVFSSVILTYSLFEVLLY